MARAPVPRITPDEVDRRLQAGEPLQLLDVRGRSYRTSDRRITGAVRIDPRELERDHQTLSHAQTIVAYCT